MADKKKYPGQEALDWILDNGHWSPTDRTYTIYGEKAMDSLQEVRRALDDSQDALGLILRHYAAGYAANTKPVLRDRLRGVRDTSRKGLGLS